MQGSPIVDRAARTELVSDSIRSLASELGAPAIETALDQALAAREIDGATVLALALVAAGGRPSAEAVERIFPDALDDRASEILVAHHPERLAILERLLASRRLDRYQIAFASALYTHLQPTPPWPGVLVESLRTLARARRGWAGEQYARQAALRMRDPHLDELFAIDRDEETLDAELFADLDANRGIDALGPKRGHVLASGYTARRATPKVGRNDACPCGSGKKYKKCCADKERTNDAWSPVAGLSIFEYRRRLHEFVDGEEMLRHHPADLARLPLAELDVEQLDACFQVFLDCARLDDAERTLDVLATRDLGSDLTVDDLRAELVTIAHDWGQDELVAKHLARFADSAKAPHYVVLGRSLREPTHETLALIEDECLDHVLGEAPPPMTLAYELLEPFPALGIVLARGCLDPEHPEDSETLLKEIEWARDRLGAPPNDPAWDVWDALRDEHQLAKVADEEKEAMRRELEAMRAQVRDARAEAQVLTRALGQHREQLAELETKAATAAATVTKTAKQRAAQEADAQAARALRHKIRELEERIREGQRERADLRRRAEDVGKELPATREVAPSDDGEFDEDGEPVSAHALRVPAWSDKARASLDRMPAKIAASAIATAGSLGAAKPEAWRHAKRLEGMHGLCSARLGIHHRLLFRIDREGLLDVEEVVTREDLDRALAARR